MPTHSLHHIRLTFFFALVGVGGADDSTLIVDYDDALDVLVGLHAIQRLLDLRHQSYIIKSNHLNHHQRLDVSLSSIDVTLPTSRA